MTDGSETSFLDPLLHHSHETEHTIRVAGDGSGEFAKVTKDDDHIHGVAVGGTSMFTHSERAAPRALGMLGAVAGGGVVRALGGEAETQTGIPGAFRVVVGASRLIVTELVAAVDGADGGRAREIPLAARIFTTENFVGVLDTIVFFAVSGSRRSNPSTRFVPVAVNGFVVEAELFTAGPPLSTNSISSFKNTALGVSIAEILVLVAAKADAAEETFSNPLAIVLDVGGTRRFGDVLAEVAAADRRIGAGVPEAAGFSKASERVGEHARIFTALDRGESGLIPQAGVQSTSQLSSAVLGVGNLRALVEAALVEAQIPGAVTIVVAGILSRITADLADATVVVSFPFTSSIEFAINLVTVLRTDIVLARRSGVFDVEVPELGAENSTSGSQTTVVALVGGVGFIAFRNTAGKVGALFRVAADADFTVTAELVAPAEEGVVTKSLASTLFIVVDESDGSLIFAAFIRDGPGGKIGQEGSNGFGGEDVVGVIGCVESLGVLFNQIRIGVITKTDETTIETGAKGSERARGGRIARLEISPVAVREEGDELGACGERRREGDVV